MTGLHEFAEFSAADVGTTDSGLNSMVLANNDGLVRTVTHTWAGLALGVPDWILVAHALPLKIERRDPM